ncbi:MAG: class I SAM-dependent methyltransferase [Gammaproteobacteria bacterium]|nr:class I SAM-dependent methyltransferase [Gammaproteobacteria bacterium]
MTEFTNGYKELDHCRVCKNTDLTTYLDLGNMPLVNSYVTADDDEKPCDRYPLAINYCPECSMSQLSIVVDPSIMFKNYFYRSSISQTFVNHCAEYAENSARRFSFRESDLVVDIASNDGACLREFKKQGVKVLGVDPAENLAKIAIESGVPTVAKFWNADTAKQLLADHGKAKMITAMNVFAHVDDLDSFLTGVNTLLDDDGVFAIECPYMFNFMTNTEFDTTYHEHLSYFLLKPIKHLVERHGFEVFDVMTMNIHGGSIRVYVKKKTSKAWDICYQNIDKLLLMEEETGFHKLNTYMHFSEAVKNIKEDMVNLIRSLKAEGKKIAAYGASAKGNILSNYCGLGKSDIDYIIDDTPEKQGYLAPGHHIPIVAFEQLKKDPPDFLILLAWNFSHELMNKTSAYQGEGGKYIIPIPQVKIVPE